MIMTSSGVVGFWFSDWAWLWFCNLVCYPYLWFCCLGFGIWVSGFWGAWFLGFRPFRLLGLRCLWCWCSLRCARFGVV